MKREPRDLSMEEHRADAGVFASRVCVSPLCLGPKEDPGVNTRALARLFEVAGERFPDVKYEIKITLLEIYNEKIQDLLGEKGRVLKAVQGQYGMEVQDLTSEHNHTQLLSLIVLVHPCPRTALPQSSSVAVFARCSVWSSQHGVRCQRSRGVRHSEAWLQESFGGRHEHERRLFPFPSDSQRLRDGAE